MKQPVEYILPPVETGKIPYWRLVLRGCSQLCFQANELTGVLFLAAVLIASPLAFAYLLVAAILAPGGRMLLGERGPILATGLPGLNPCLIALAIPTFYYTVWTDVGMWMVLLASVGGTLILTRLCVAFLPMPTLAFPFLITFWSLSALAPNLDVLQPIEFAVPDSAALQPLLAVLRSIGESLFCPNLWSGLLIFSGVLLSNWRHGLLALFGAVIGTVVSCYHREVVDTAGINLGLYGFNGVLTAVSVFVFCDGKLRLAILGALLAAIMMPALAGSGVPTLSAPFVFTTWLMLGLGWIEDSWFAVPTAASSATGPNSDRMSPPAHPAPGV